MVNNISGPEDPKDGYGKPVSYKGYAPGTFSISTAKGGPATPVITGVAKFRVGGEIKNPEMEEIIRLGKLAQKEGFNFEVNTQGEIEASIPEEFLEEEKMLKEQLKKSEIEKLLLRELFPLSIQFTALVKDSEFLVSKLQIPKTADDIEKVSKKIDTLLKNAEINPTREKVTDLIEKLEEFERVVERAKNEISKIPLVPPVIPIAAPVTPATAPVQKPLNEYSGWPHGVLYFKKVKGNGKGEWFSNKDSVNPLSNQEAWILEKESFDIVFKKYSDFIKNLGVEEKRFAGELIDAKNKVVEALKKLDLSSVEILREEFEIAIEKWKVKWPTVSKVKKIEEQFRKNSVLVAKIKDNLNDSNEKQNLTKKELDLEKIIEGVLTKLKSDSITEDDYVSLESKATSYTTLLETYKKRLFSNDPRRPVLRPIKISSNLDATIAVIGRGDVLLKDRAIEEVDAITAKTTATASKEAQSTQLLEKKHISMYERAPAAYIQMYTIRREKVQQNGTIQVSYYLKNFIEGDQNKSVVEKMLEDTKDIEVKLSELQENKNKAVVFVLDESRDNKREPVMLAKNRTISPHPDSIHAYRQTYAPVLGSKTLSSGEKTEIIKAQEEINNGTREKMPEIQIKDSRFARGMVSAKDMDSKLNTAPAAKYTTPDASPVNKKDTAVEKLWKGFTNSKMLAGNPDWVNAVILSLPLTLGVPTAFIGLQAKDYLQKKELAERTSPSKVESGWKAYLTEDEKAHLTTFERSSPSEFIASWLTTKDATFVNKISNYNSEDIKDILLNPTTTKATDGNGVNHQLAISKMIQFGQNVSQKKDAPMVYQSTKDSSFYTNTKNWWVGPGETFNQFLQAVHVKIFNK